MFMAEATHQELVELVASQAELITSLTAQGSYSPGVDGVSWPLTRVVAG
jgi:hypothetical protein